MANLHCRTCGRPLPYAVPPPPRLWPMAAAAVVMALALWPLLEWWSGLVGILFVGIGIAWNRFAAAAIEKQCARHQVCPGCGAAYHARGQHPGF